MSPWIVAALALALAAHFARRAHSLRIQALACPESARQRIEHLFLVTEEHGERNGLKLAMDLIDRESDDDPDAGDYATVISTLARHAHRTGDDRAAMLETYAAASNCPALADTIEASVSRVLEGGS